MVEKYSFSKLVVKIDPLLMKIGSLSVGAFNSKFSKLLHERRKYVDSASPVVPFMVNNDGIIYV